MLVNRSFNLIKSDIETIKNAIQSHFKERLVIQESHYAPVDIHLETPLVYNSIIEQMILWQPANASGTAMYGTQRDGFSSIGWILNHCFNLEVIQISVSYNLEPGDGGHSPYYAFVHYSVDGRERWVRVMWDNRWEFYERGDPMPFEQTEKYTERIRRKRLTNDMVFDYAKAMGWDLRDPLFWTSPKDAFYMTYRLKAPAQSNE